MTFFNQNVVITIPNFYLMRSFSKVVDNFFGFLIAFHARKFLFLCREKKIRVSIGIVEKDLPIHPRNSSAGPLYQVTNNGHATSARFDGKFGSEEFDNRAASVWKHRAQ